MPDRRFALLAFVVFVLLAVVIVYAPPWFVRATFGIVGFGLLLAFLTATRNAERSERDLARRHPDELLPSERERVLEHLWLEFDKALRKRHDLRVDELARGIARFSLTRSPGLYRQLSKALRRHGYEERALSLLEESNRKEDGEALSLVHEAFLHTQLGDAERAIELLSGLKRHTLDSDTMPLWTAVWAIANAGDSNAFKDDINFLRTIVNKDLSDDEFIACYALSIAEEALGSTPRAIQALRGFLKSEQSRVSPASREQALLRLGELYRREGRAEEAMAAYLLAAKGKSRYATLARDRYVG